MARIGFAEKTNTARPATEDVSWTSKKHSIKNQKNNMYYILDNDGEVTAISDIMEWAKAFENGDGKKNRFIARDNLKGHFVSTVFLGIDHSFGEPGGPVLFETMVFKDNKVSWKAVENEKGEVVLDYHPSVDEYTERYRTKEEALEGHKAVVEKVKQYENSNREN